MTLNTSIRQNYLTPTNFKFNIKRLPNVSFFCQSVNIPGLSFPPTEMHTPFKNVYVPGHGKLEIGQFTVTAAVDENMHNYLEIYNWMIGLTFPHDFTEYANLVEGEGLVSDATLHIMSNSKNPNVSVSLKDIFPISLGDINMSITETDTPTITFDVAFQVNSFSINA